MPKVLRAAKFGKGLSWVWEGISLEVKSKRRKYRDVFLNFFQ